jgi:hypothetical protein
LTAQLSSLLSSKLSLSERSLDDRAKSPSQALAYPFVLQRPVADDRLDLDLLDDEDPFEIDAQAAHLFKHPRLGIEDIRDV